MSVFQGMVGALISGVGAAIWGVPGLVLGLILAFVYFQRTTKL